MNFHYNKDTLIRYLPYEVHKLLRNSLESNKALEKIEKKCREIFEEIKPTYYEALSCTRPIEKMVNNLIEKQCTIYMLTEILRESELYETLSIFLTEQMIIKMQPTDDAINNTKIIKRGKPFNLNYLVWGIPQPNYRWYKENNILPEKTDSLLLFETYTLDLEGNYYCEAIQTFIDGTVNILTSKVVQVATLEESCVIISKPPLELCVRTSPIPQRVELKVVADGHPKPEYQWIHNNKVLPFTTPNIMIPNEKKYEGEYRCRISNAVSEDKITITNYRVIDEGFIFPIYTGQVIEKIALLIGNEDYKNHDQLSTPVKDIHAIRSRLEARNFLVLSPFNCNLQVMKDILQIFERMCVQACFAFFYYTGHGFELSEKYLMPIDTPDSAIMRLEHSISEYEILQKILNRKPKLFVTIFDMCLKIPNRTINSEIYEDKSKIFEYKSNRNLIQGYSTSTGSSAYEFGKRENSAYNSRLQHYMDNNKPILEMFLKLNNDFDKKRINKNTEQMPSVSFNISQDFSFNVQKQGDPNCVQFWNYYNMKAFKTHH